MVLLALGACDSWSRLRSVHRIAAVADASTYLFKAMHNLRVDRASSTRDLMADRQFTLINQQIRDAREAEMPALRSALVALAPIDFPDRDAVIARIGDAVKRLATLHQESAPAFLRPKSERRPGLAQDMFNETNGLIETIEKVSSQLTRLVKLDDGLIDQLMAIKQLAWVMRNAGGDASVLISNTLGGQPPPADAWVRYTAHVSKMETAWTAIADIAAGLPLPPRFGEAMDRARREFFGRDYADQRAALLKALIAGQQPDMTVERWTPITIPRLAAALGVAEAALDAAKEHAARQQSQAMSTLVFQLALLIG